MARKKTTRKPKTKRVVKVATPGVREQLRALVGRMVLRFVVLVGVLVLAYSVWLDIGIRGQFEGRRWQLPARIYARPLTLYPGAILDPKDLIAEFKALNYRVGLSRAASYQVGPDSIEVLTRSFQFWDGLEPARKLRLAFNGKRLRAITQNGRLLPLVRIEPQLIGRIYPHHNEDRILVRLDDVPPLLIKALLAVEDRNFYDHYGISPTGMARAMLTNLQAGQTLQGGSTLTQQLAKSYFLTNERSLIRKISDVLIALILEARYSKNELLEAYLNEIYLGQRGQRAIHGFGLAAQFYFGRHLNELNLPEIALLVGLVKGPSYYNPRRQRKRALQRRNLVLRIMSEQGVIDPGTASEAGNKALGVIATVPPSSSPHPAFLDLVKRQLQRDYRREDLQSEGLRIFTSLDPVVQHATETAIISRLAQLEKARKLPKGKLQGAVVITDTHNGQVLALAGGRKPRDNGFNRALDAHRPIGSLIKPFVYLSALEKPQQYHLLSPIDDAPVRLKNSGSKIWKPKNYDGKSHGYVPLIQALAHSYNQATVRLGLQIGIKKVIANLKAAGLTQPINAYPSLLLGAVELSPLQVSGMYQTLAAGGFRQPLRAIRNVTDKRGAPLERYPLTLDTALDPKATFLTLRAMQEVMRTGTGRYASNTLPVAAALAGKTGTTDDLRDSWFAGFGADHLTVVWLGRDDNRSVRLTGASGALRLWTDIMAKLRPQALNMPAPAGIRWSKVSKAAMMQGLERLDDCTSGEVMLPYIANPLRSADSCRGQLNQVGTRGRRLPGATSQVRNDNRPEDKR